ncbi:MAG: hypothetical protein NTX46_04770 [Chloroflexi bacterium]|nr:hypothetical protein [Chloroflexota bacterium]
MSNPQTLNKFKYQIISHPNPPWEDETQEILYNFRIKHKVTAGFEILHFDIAEDSVLRI